MLNASWWLCILVVLCACGPTTNGDARNDGSNLLRSRNFDRHPQKINYSKHARCRMDCRGIDENEVRLALEKGEVNYRKSQLKTQQCQSRFALEAPTPDGQQVRIIFAPCGNETTVVTVIDLNQKKDEPNCICK